MELLSIAAILLGFLALLLGAGVWIAVALMATGWAGMQFAGGGIPAGSVLVMDCRGDASVASAGSTRGPVIRRDTL